MKNSKSLSTLLKLGQQDASLKSELAEIQVRLEEIRGENTQHNAVGDLYCRIKQMKKERKVLEQQVTARDRDTAQLKNQLEYLKIHAKKAKQDKAALLKLCAQQQHAFNARKPQKNSIEKVQSLRDELKSTRDQYKDLLSRLKTLEIDWKRNKRRLSDLNGSLHSHNTKHQEYTQETTLAQLTRSLRELKHSRKQEGSKGAQLLLESETDLAHLQDTHQSLTQAILSKQQDLKLKQIKLKDLKIILNSLKTR